MRRITALFERQISGLDVCNSYIYTVVVHTSAHTPTHTLMEAMHVLICLCMLKSAGVKCFHAGRQNKKVGMWEQIKSQDT